MSNALYMSTIFCSATDRSISILSSVTFNSVSINLQTGLTPMDSSFLPRRMHTLLQIVQTPARTHLLLNGTPIPVVEETKFLGVIFDRCADVPLRNYTLTHSLCLCPPGFLIFLSSAVVGQTTQKGFSLQKVR